ncbi:MAG: malate synthase A [Bacteroidota bacterium]
MIETKTTILPHGIEIKGALQQGYEDILTFDALELLALLHRNLNQRRKGLLTFREIQTEKLEEGAKLDFLRETQAIRDGDWTVAPIPNDLQDRRVEITGPVERKMVINALNSGAKVFMADFEDSNSPTWDNNLQGQINLRDAVNRSITFYHKKKDKHYQLNEEVATLMVRPRGWHLLERHVWVDGEEVSGGLMDFALYTFHNASELISRGSAPYFYLPKLEHYLEARLWNDAFILAQSYLGLPLGTIKATVLVETLPASFQLDEILYELRDHSAGLNCGRWDYIFSFIKKLGKRPEYLMPDRDQVGMTVPFMEAYTSLVIKTCHKRNVHAMGGMAAQIPIKNDDEANAKALEKVRKDKEREAKAGHDGSWVAHPALVPVAMEQFDRFMPTANQIYNKREDVSVSAEDLTAIPQGSITEAGLRKNIDVGIQYIEAWLRGNGCVPIYHLMEDAATAEISRTQIWQWLRHPEATLIDGRPITLKLYQEMLPEQLSHIQVLIGEEAYKAGKFDEAAKLFDELVTSEKLEEFLTLKAYAYI